VERTGIVFGWSKIDWAKILGLNWSGKGCNIWMNLETNGLELLIGDGKQWAGIFGSGWMSKGCNFWIELVWNICLELESNWTELEWNIWMEVVSYDLEYLE
jgi:hypothetical protein